MRVRYLRSLAIAFDYETEKSTTVAKAIISLERFLIPTQVQG